MSNNHFKRNPYSNSSQNFTSENNYPPYNNSGEKTYSTYGQPSSSFYDNHSDYLSGQHSQKNYEPKFNKYQKPLNPECNSFIPTQQYCNSTTNDIPIVSTSSHHDGIESSTINKENGQSYHNAYKNTTEIKQNSRSGYGARAKDTNQVPVREVNNSKQSRYKNVRKNYNEHYEGKSNSNPRYSYQDQENNSKSNYFYGRGSRPKVSTSYSRSDWRYSLPLPKRGKDFNKTNPSTLQNKMHGRGNNSRNDKPMYNQYQDYVDGPYQSMEQESNCTSAYNRPTNQEKSDYSMHKRPNNDSFSKNKVNRTNIKSFNELCINENKNYRSYNDKKHFSKNYTNNGTEISENKIRKKLDTLTIQNEDGKTQRESLIELLTQGTYECMVCCDRIKQTHAIWSCNKCFNCFHLGCTKKWAGTSQGDPGWRCPACQNLNEKMPSGYFCYCHKLREPEWNRREIPHSCGEMCGKKRENEWCHHKCTSLCHPGPCLDCSAFIKRNCCCGKNSKEMKCSVIDPYLCNESCEKFLNCEVHKCQQLCHKDSCIPCDIMISKECHCGKEKKEMLCDKETAEIVSFSCSSICEKLLSCGKHNCDRICHEGSCNECEKAVELVTTCPCGKLTLKEIYLESNLNARSICTDPIPTCKNICGQILKCGNPGSFHTCKSYCHEGPCPQCPAETKVKCRCGNLDKFISCVDLKSKADEVTCEKQCKKFRQCGRHKCGQKCCIDVDHLCTRICGKNLKCKLHRCQETCHRGNCPRCWETSFDELSCHCGASVIFPPVPCGTQPPICTLPCTRPQPCTHPVTHVCHTDQKCPPCTTLVTKPCYGDHMMMKSTPCYVNAMSCGDRCNRMLPCGLHKCQKVCHDGDCIKGARCNQKCLEKRTLCEHPCNNPCHSGPCPNTSCKEMVTVYCTCGNHKLDMACCQNEKEYKSLANSKIASMMHSMSSGGSADISQIFSGSSANRAEKFKRLECSDECLLIQRNQRLALALQITNPFTRDSLGDNPLYTESMKDEAKKDLAFANMIHNTLNDLVLKAKESKQKSRSHSFAPMNRDKRRFIHEYSKFFSCQSQAYDEEPKKNVVVTADKFMSQLPPISVVTVIQREKGQRKGPDPVLSRKTVGPSPGSEENSSLKKLEKGTSFEKKESSPENVCSVPSEPAPIIDYFDMN